MDNNTHGRGNLIITASIAYHVQVAFVADIIYVPGNFIGMGFDDDTVFGAGVYDSHCGAVGVSDVFVNKGANVLQPYFLSGFFETRWRVAVQVLVKEFFAGGVHSWLFCVKHFVRFFWCLFVCNLAQANT